MTITSFASQGDSLALCLAQDGTGPDVVLREDEQTGEGERNSGDDGEDTAGDADAEEEPSTDDADPAVSLWRAPIHAH